MKVKRTLLSTVCCLALVLTAIPIGLMAGAQTYASGAAAEQAMHVVTADDVRVSSRNNATEYVWPIFPVMITAFWSISTIPTPMRRICSHSPLGAAAPGWGSPIRICLPIWSTRA